MGIEQSDRMALSTFRRHQPPVPAPDKDRNSSSAAWRVLAMARKTQRSTLRSSTRHRGRHGDLNVIALRIRHSLPFASRIENFGLERYLIVV
jgi:hypothetical protein